MKPSCTAIKYFGGLRQVSRQLRWMLSQFLLSGYGKRIEISIVVINIAVFFPLEEAHD